ncbi:MAG: hypothetical protein R6X08_00280 [Desulfosalsimonadaceae bacterium]
MKGITIFLFATAIFLAGFPAVGAFAEDPGDLEACYNAQITKKIECCKCTAQLFNTCCNRRMKQLKQMRAQQADFYEANREALVNAMMTDKVNPRPDAVEYYLISRFQKNKRLCVNR